MIKEIDLSKSDPEVEAVLARLQSRNDFKSLRIKRLLSLPDLTRTTGSPLKMIVDAILAMPRFQNFDVIRVPEVVSTEKNFDLLNTPPDHPSRRETDTYYLEENWILRTHTTVMWSYHLAMPETRKKSLKPARPALSLMAKFTAKTKLIARIIPFSTKLTVGTFAEKTYLLSAKTN
jgi:phenylalanyl-tRNA synthetase alpha subunit